MARSVSKVRKALPKGVNMEQIPNSASRPGEWRKSLVHATSASGEVNKNTQVPPAIQEQMIAEVANGIPAGDIERKYEVSRGYLYSLMVKKFGSIEAMKRQLTSMCYENAMVFMEYANRNIEQMTPAQAVLSAKLSIDSGLALEKSSSEKPATIDFATLQQIGSVILRVEKAILGVDRTLPSPASQTPAESGETPV